MIRYLIRYKVQKSVNGVSRKSEHSVTILGQHCQELYKLPVVNRIVSIGQGYPVSLRHTCTAGQYEKETEKYLRNSNITHKNNEITILNLKLSTVSLVSSHGPPSPKIWFAPSTLTWSALSHGQPCPTTIKKTYSESSALKQIQKTELIHKQTHLYMLINIDVV
jgi:hypothetical protein